MNLHKSLILLGTLGLVTLGSIGISPALADNPNNSRDQRQETRHRQDNNYRRDNRREREYRHRQDNRGERGYCYRQESRSGRRY